MCAFFVALGRGIRPVAGRTFGNARHRRGRCGNILFTVATVIMVLAGVFL